MSEISKRLQADIEGVASRGSDRVPRIVDKVLEEAFRNRCSDIHFEPGPDHILIRLRIDGLLVPAIRLDRELGPNLVARLKVLAELLTYRVDIPQEGSVRYRGNGDKPYDLRISTFPTIHGEKVVIRVFSASGEGLEIDQLGLPEDVVSGLIRQMQERTGAILLTGPSGSGKTTTIYACLRHLVQMDGGGRNIVSIEDPVEQAVAGVSQSQARPGTEFDFARGLRSLLRQDPEVIMIGEIRDRETAAIGIQAALTGHLVFSTLHSGSSCGVIGRLMEMGIEPYLLTSSLKAVINQRLVRKLCQSCKNREPGKCDSCAGTGYHGRVLLAEILQMDDNLRKAILRSADTADLEAIVAHGRIDIWKTAQQAIDNQLTSSQEILRVLGPGPIKA